MTRIFDIREPSLDALRDAPIYFRYGSNKRRVLVDRLTAGAILAVHDALTDDANKSKLARMVAGTPAQLQRVANFALSRVQITGSERPRVL